MYRSADRYSGRSINTTHLHDGQHGEMLHSTPSNNNGDVLNGREMIMGPSEFKGSPNEAGLGRVVAGQVVNKTGSTGQTTHYGYGWVPAAIPLGPTQ